MITQLSSLSSQHTPRLCRRLLASFTAGNHYEDGYSKRGVQARKLSHLHHFWGDENGGLIKYEDAEKLQEAYRTRLLNWKALSAEDRSIAPKPKNVVIAFECEPTFTLGRRQSELSPEDEAALKNPLLVDLRDRFEPLKGTFTPVVKSTPRGGLTTYHGPGQLVLWPVVDMHGGAHAKLSVVSYAQCLEQATQELLADLFSIETFTNKDEPGVWVQSQDPSKPAKKIAALGVHHRRYVTSLGTAINFDIPVTGGLAVNPWSRFVPCGLEGKEVTSVARELGKAPIEGWNVGHYAQYWTKKFERITNLWG